jgi:hypothetical protein
LKIIRLRGVQNALDQRLGHFLAEFTVAVMRVEVEVNPEVASDAPDGRVLLHAFPSGWQ